MKIETQTYKFIKFTPFKSFSYWDVKKYLKSKDVFNSKFDLVSFSSFSDIPKIEKIKIKDEETYKILGVRSYGLGVYVNRIVQGDTLKMRTYQKAKSNHLFWCKVDTKNGGFGVINDDLSDGIASSNMTFLELNSKKINSSFIQILFRSVKFNNFMDSFVTGTTNRKYIRPIQLFEDVKIPLPPLSEQNRIVSEYNKKITKLNKLEKQVQNLHFDIEKYLFEKLGIKLPKEKEKKKGLNFVKFSELTDKWNVLDINIDIERELKKSIHPLKTIGSVYEIINRNWKKNWESDIFKYVELGAISPLNGIVKFKELPVKKAPSRATQLIKTGDFILGTTRPYLKKFAIVSKEFNNFVCSSGFAVFNQRKEKYDLYFLKEFLMSTFGIEQFNNKMTGALYPAITTSELKTIKIPFPPLEQQKEITKHIKKLKKLAKQKELEIQELKKLAIKEFEENIFKQ